MPMSDQMLKIPETISQLDLIGPFAQKIPQTKHLKLFIDAGGDLREQQEQGPIIGDGDSTKARPDYSFPADKDYSDLMGALNLIPGHISELALYGFLGHRKDHELANIGELNHFLSGRENTVAHFFEFNDNGHQQEMSFYSRGQWKVPYSGAFGLITFVVQEIDLQGIVNYPIDKSNTIRPFSSHAISNFSKNGFSLSCQAPVLITFNQQREPK